MLKKIGITFSLLFIMASCATVDETEWCAKTRYGKVIAEQVETGLHIAIIHDYTCFDMTERIYPSEEEVETMDAQTRDQLTINGDVSVVVLLNPSRMSETFRDKRRPTAIDSEIRSAIRNGYRDAFAGWSVNEIFSNQRSALSDSVQAHIQRKLGEMATVERVYVRELSVPPQIEAARIEASQQENLYIAATRRAQIDSVNAWAEIQKLAAQAEGQRLMANALDQSPGLLGLRAAEAMSQGLAQACNGVQTCILGGDVMDRFLTTGLGGM